MRTSIVGAGPTGLFLAMALARRGHQVTLLDRDAGPDLGGSWQRRGVMQFHHPHAFRSQVVDALTAETPEVWEDLLAAGAEAVQIPDAPIGVTAVRCRRLVFERVLRNAAIAEPGVTFRHGQVDTVVSTNGRVSGVEQEGVHLDADLVLDASGRAGRLTRGLRAAANGADCGFAYVSQQHELLPSVEPGPLNAPIGLLAGYPGYLAIVFPHDNRTFSTLVMHATDDRELMGLREPAAFAAALRAIPAFAAWTGPDRSRPIGAVTPGGHLYNTYRGQRAPDGRPTLPGLISVGDAVCTTNPSAGRGVALSFMQARRLLALLEEHGSDLAACALDFDDWCTLTIRPWFEDHVTMDAHLARRWHGEGIDATQPLPSDLVVAAAQADPTLMSVVGPYLGMFTQPCSLDAVQPRAKEIYASGWRPPAPQGPSRDELAALVAVSRHGSRSPARRRRPSDATRGGS